MSEEPIKVLLIEDNPGDIRLIREMLAEAKGATFHLECAERLKTGLERLAKSGIDVVLLDLGLPESQGLDTFARAKAQTPGVPIVVLTALEDEALGIKAVQTGAQDYLVKGQVDTRLLACSIRYAIERKRAEEALRKRTHDLGERVKELDCLYRMSNLVQKEGITLEEILQETVNLIPPAWQYPEITCSRIIFQEKEYKSENFEKTKWRLCADIVMGNEKVGLIEVCYLEKRPDESEGPFLKAEQDLINSIAEILANITQRRRLESEIVQISSREQRRIGQDLHDGLGQHLTGIAFLSKVLQRKLAAKSLAEAADAQEIAKLVNQAIVESRRLSRGLSPVDLSADGLMLALQELASNAEKLFGISCNFKCDKPVLIDGYLTATHLYRIAQEAVDNAIKHGKAKNVLIGLSAVNDRIILTVKDDGVGLPEVLDKNKGMGLHIMDYRARMIGASFDIRRDTEGGTIVICSFRNINDRK